MLGAFVSALSEGIRFFCIRHSLLLQQLFTSRINHNPSFNHYCSVRCFMFQQILQTDICLTNNKFSNLEAAIVITYLIKKMSETAVEIQMDDSKMDDILKAWKSKSLNSKFMERYKIQFDRSKEDRQDQSKKKDSKQVETQKSNTQFKNELLPEPKFVKINQEIFCLYLHKCLVIFKFLSKQEKQFFKPKQSESAKTFYSSTHFFEEQIRFVIGNNSTIYLGLENELNILRLEYKKEIAEDGKYKEYNPIKQQERKVIPKIKGIGFIRELKDEIELPLLVVVTNDKIIKFKHNPAKDERDKPLEEYEIIFSSRDDQANFKQINTIQIICENNIYLYLFGTKEGVRREMNEKYQGKQRKCECLYLVKFNLETSNEKGLKPILYMIDHVFETGIFNKSKIYQSGPSVFLISLFEEIIVIKYHFERYVVWDNISLAPSKTNQKKGQLILADKIVMVYTESSEISAHNIFFSFKESKLKYPRIDNFKANVNEDQILYDAIVLEYEQGSFMKVLFYFKQHQVSTPNNRFAVHKDEKTQGENKSFTFYIRCIQQDSPLVKLAQLFRGKKTPQQISQFVQRFNISEIDKSKCEWSVSEKTEKDIEGLLLEIKDNEYIQNELTMILKSSPHDLKFLSRIEKKQIQRYKKMLILKLLKHTQKSSYEKIKKVTSMEAIRDGYEGGFSKKEEEQIKEIIKWVMESIMFEKKLLYSKNFLEFMEYDFIEIGKLKAASLKQEIKLLSCKGFEKRLLYFLNSFKYMILDKFEDIFEFLIENKSQEEVEKFFKESFPFILPKFKQKVKVFKQKNVKGLMQIQKLRKQRKFSFANNLPSPIELKRKESNRKQIESESEKSQNENDNIVKSSKEKKGDGKEEQSERKKQQCQLWVNKFGSAEEMRKIETIRSFEDEVSLEIKVKYLEITSKGQYNQLKDTEAIKEFSRILNEFIQEDWFKNNKSKQHSIIESDIPTLKKKMKDYKRIGVFHLLIKFFYSKIASQIYTIGKIDEVLYNFKIAGLIPESFQQNILARRDIYEKIKRKKKPEVALPILERFLIFEQTDYFDYLFRHYREMLLTEIKSVYDGILAGWFKEIFKMYLDSQKIQLPQIIKFLQFFEGNSNVDIRMDVFTCIKNLLKVNDKTNTSSFVDKLMELEVLKKEGNSHSGIDSLIDEAKIAFGCYFYSFFQVFSISSTYKELINQTFLTEYEECRIIKTILEKYCNEDYIKNFNTEAQDDQEQALLRLEPSFGLEQVQFSIVDQPLDFFGILLYLIDTLRFEVPSEVVFDKFLELQLNCRKYHSIVKFISDFREFIGGENDEYSEESNDSNERIESKNYSLLKIFYNDSSFTIQERLIDNILIWVRKKYKSIFEGGATLFTHNCNKTFSLIKDTFERVVDELNIQSPELLRQRAFLGMLENIKQIQSSLLKYVLERRFENFDVSKLEESSPLLNQISPFNFMMRILNQIPKEKFDQQDKNITSKEINLFECIYEQFTSASRYQSSEEKSEQSGLSRFYVELTMRLIEDKQFAYCQQVLANKCILKDPFYQFLALIQPNQRKPSEDSFKKFIRDFIQVSHEKNQTQMFTKFLVQNGISELQGDSSQQFDMEKQSAHFIVEKQKSVKQSEAKDLLDARRKSKNQPNMPTIRQASQGNRMKFSLTIELKPSTLTNIIFLTLIESHRVEEAYYFLVRSKMLSVATATQLGTHKDSTQSHALISIYLKCLREFLCQQFYPTFSFYKSKHQILLNQYERKDIIKDINIAISQMKEMISEERLKSSKNQFDNHSSSNIFGKVLGEIFQKKSTPQPEAKPAQLLPQKIKLDELQEKRTQEKKEQRKNYMRSLQDHLNELKSLYEAFMKSISLDPKIKLNEVQVKQGKDQSEKINRLIPTDQLDKFNRDRNFPASPRFESLKESIKGQGAFNFNPVDLKKSSVPYEQKQLEQQKRKIRQNPKFVELQKQINMQVKQTKLLSQQYERDQNPVLKATSQARQKNVKKYQDLKEKEKHEIDSAKQSYRSQTSSRVQQILEDVKLRKQKIADKSDVKSKYSKVQLEESEGERSRKNSFERIPNAKFTYLISPPEIQMHREKSESMTSNSIDQSKKYEVKVRGIDGNVKNIFMPVTMSKQEKQASSRVSLQSREPINIPEMPKANSRIGFARSEIQTEIKIRQDPKAKPVTVTKTTVDEIRKLFADKEPQCVKYVDKLEIVRNNPQVGLQITKNIYSSVHSFEVFVRYIGFLLQNFPPYKEVLEEKAYKIAVQAMGIEHKINLKELFPIQLFTKVMEGGQRQYYKTAYQLMRPSLLKILARPQTNIHGMAILFRFGFGSQNTYYHRVYEDYIKVLLKQYSESNMQEKRLFSLAEKLRSLYSNINGQNRQNKFEQLLREIGNESKRKVLTKQMLKILERRNQMLTGEKQTDLRQVLTKLS